RIQGLPRVSGNLRRGLRRRAPARRLRCRRQPALQLHQHAGRGHGYGFRAFPCHRLRPAPRHRRSGQEQGRVGPVPPLPHPEGRRQLRHLHRSRPARPLWPVRRRRRQPHAHRDRAQRQGDPGQEQGPGRPRGRRHPHPLLVGRRRIRSGSGARPAPRRRGRCRGLRHPGRRRAALRVDRPHMTGLPDRARAVIIGGGVIGCSVAYHLAKLGWRDVVLLERKQLTCGTTWHAAGLIGQLRATANMTKLAHYGAGLYAGLEAETGVATGFRRVGSISLALTRERLEELARGASMARAFGVEVEEISVAEAARRHPLIDMTGVVGAIYLPRDGQADPGNVALSMARGATKAGVTVRENTPVTGILVDKGRVRGVTTPAGRIAADVVINCAGMWGREVGRMAGVHLPLQACEHFYIVTEPSDEVPSGLPVLRVTDECAYYKQDAGKILLGAFEPRAKPWGVDGIPRDFYFDELPADLEHFAPILEMATRRMPLLGRLGIRAFFNGPESFTHDNRYLLGEVPEVAGFFVACGFNSVGIQSAAGAGKALAEWIVGGEPPFDLWDVDVRRTFPWQSTRAFIVPRVSETLGLLYADHFPFRQFVTSRGVRHSPVHDQLAARGAFFGEVAGWERPHWFLPAAEVAKGKSP